VGLGALIAGVALAGPHVTLPVAGTVGGIEGASWPALLPLVVAAVAALLAADRNLPPTPVSGVGLLVACCAATVFAAVKLADASAAVDAAAGGSVGWGAILLLTGCGVAAAGSAVSVVAGVRT
jgi:hypothetical protein